jgi:LmbE family N-acetylglucosaminyl deacetylase
VRRADVLFLGYPDGGLKTMYEMTGDVVYRSPLTEKNETYGPVVRDYHSQVHGRPVPYLKASLIDDLAEIIRSRRPQEIYITNEIDKHADHRFAFRFVRDAAAVAGYRGSLLTYVVHGDPPPNPPGVRLTLTEQEQQQKRATILSYQAGVSPVHDYLADTYARPEELFWPVRVEREE